MVRTKNPYVGSDASSSPSRQSPKSPLSQSQPKKFRPKVASNAAPLSRLKAKGVVIKEPVQTRSKSKETTPGKGKRKVLIPSDSSDSTSSLNKKDLELKIAKSLEKLHKGVMKKQRYPLPKFLLKLLLDQDCQLLLRDSLCLKLVNPLSPCQNLLLDLIPKS